MNTAYVALEDAIRSGDIARSQAEASRLAGTGIAPQVMFRDCIEPLLKDIGDRFSRLEIFLPEMMEAAEAVKAVQESLKPYLKAGEQGQQVRGKIALCTIEGDLHDIGKNIVRAMLEVNGFEVRDLGVDVSPANAVNAARDSGANILAISALMLPSLPYMKDAIELVKANPANRDRFKVLVGGGPVSDEWARRAGADGYGEDAVEAVTQALRLAGS